ncbi:helix-turn-helix transcriptional regulator [Bradyrhizobium sp. Gha]|uniref:ArsR/SmtB family transcription factor n=1 Tax=Bradyrhizobium sp. Gha TaxID=1855318 RepID=UPI0008EF8FC6|nr:helix-turn-helix transcriptional regulator [Bradyrhizobium sp. Gha]SFH65873.1 DNA-binding transcriptional regulator, ArsR family [Bradyrhizobium sp. Gha]
MDAVLHALAHAHRRRILDLVGTEPGVTVGRLARNFDVSRIAIMNHLTVLERVSLVLSERDGTARRLYLNTVPIRMIYERWTDAFSGHWAGHLLGIKQAAESAGKGGKGDG